MGRGRPRPDFNIIEIKASPRALGDGDVQMALPGRRLLTPAAATAMGTSSALQRRERHQDAKRREKKEFKKKKKGKKPKPGRTWQSQRPEAALTVDQLLHLMVPGPQVGLGVGSLGREGLAARGGAGLCASPGSAGGRRLVVPELPVSAVPGALACFRAAALAGDGHGEEPGGRAAASPQRRHGPGGRRSFGAAREQPGLAPLRAPLAARRFSGPGPRQHPPGGQSPPPGARGPGRAGPRLDGRGAVWARARSVPSGGVGGGGVVPHRGPALEPASTNQASRVGPRGGHRPRPSVRRLVGARRSRARGAAPASVMLVSKRVKRLLQLVPGKRRFGVYRFLPFFFLLGGAMEWFMINVRIGKETFYDVYRRKRSERQYEARMEKNEF